MKRSLYRWMMGVCAAGTLLSCVWATAAAGSVEAGQATFEKRCTGCHSLDRNKEGPKLRGVYGRHAASVADFQYSTALKQANVTWTEDTLERWLKDPETLVPDNDMAFHVGDAKERENIIAYLKSATGN